MRGPEVEKTECGEDRWYGGHEMERKWGREDMSWRQQEVEKTIDEEDRR